MKKFWVGKVIGIILLVFAGIAVFSFIVMSLWNAILVSVLHVGVITFWQAVGIFILSKILFGGFKGRGNGWKGDMRRHGEWRHEMREKWQNMTPEEKEKYKQDFRDRCRGRWNRQQEPFERMRPEQSTRTEQNL